MIPLPSTNRFGMDGWTKSGNVYSPVHGVHTSDELLWSLLAMTPRPPVSRGSESGYLVCTSSPPTAFKPTQINCSSGSNAPGLKSTVTSSLWISSSSMWTSTAQSQEAEYQQRCVDVFYQHRVAYIRYCEFLPHSSLSHYKQVVVGSRKRQPLFVVHFPYCSLSFMRRMLYWIIQCMVSNHTLTCAVHAGVCWCSLQIKSGLNITCQHPGMIMVVGISWNLPLSWLLTWIWLLLTICGLFEF